MSPFLSTSTQFPEGRQYLGSHYLYNEESRMAQREPSLFSVVIDPHRHSTSTLSHATVGLTLRLLQLFLYMSRPLKFDRLSMPAYHRHFSQVSLPFSEFVHHQNCPLSLSNHPEGAAVIYVNTQLQLLYYTFLSYMTRAWGMPTSFVHSFIFPHLAKGLGPTGSPLPPMGRS
jgi:hypothetical protein